MRRIVPNTILTSIVILLAVPLISDYWNEREKLLNYLIIVLAFGVGLWILAVKASRPGYDPLGRSKLAFSFIVALMTLGVAAMIASGVLGKVLGTDNAGFDPFYTAMFPILLFASFVYILFFYLFVFEKPKSPIHASSAPTLPKGYYPPKSWQNSESKLDNDHDTSTLDYDHDIPTHKHTPTHEDATHSSDDGGGDDFGGD